MMTRSNQFRQRAHHIFDKAKIKIEPSVQKSIWRLRSAIENWPGFELSPSNGLRVLNKDVTQFLQIPFFLVELRKALLEGC